MKQYLRITISNTPSVTEALTAYELKNIIMDTQGIDLPVICGIGKPCQGDIVIGNSLQLQGHQYRFFDKEGVLTIAAASEYAYQACMRQLKDMFVTKKEMGDDVSFEGDASEYFERDSSSYYITHREGDARVMIFNIYGWNGCGGVALRTQMQQSLIASYLPDVVGFQEFGDFKEDLTCRSALKSLLAEIGYREVEVCHESGTNCTPLFYNVSTLRLKEEKSCGYLCYSGPNDVHSKSLTWAVFETLQGQKTFCAVSTHFMWDQPKLTNPNEVRVSNAKELLNVVASIQDKYGKDLPIIAGGDLNCYPCSDPVKTLIEGGLHWFYDIANEKQEYGYPGYPTYDENKKIYTRFGAGPKYNGDSIENDRTIDLIAGCGKMNVLTYITINDQYALCSSDHAPKMTDIILC